jgi:hypothetical protein
LFARWYLQRCSYRRYHDVSLLSGALTAILVDFSLLQVGTQKGYETRFTGTGYSGGLDRRSNKADSHFDKPGEPGDKGRAIWA